MVFVNLLMVLQPEVMVFRKAVNINRLSGRIIVLKLFRFEQSKISLKCIQCITNIQSSNKMFFKIFNLILLRIYLHLNKV